MRVPGREEPEVALGHVVDEHCSVGIENGNARIAVEHDGPFICGVPMQLAVAAASEAHGDASEVGGGSEFALGYLVRPAAFLHAIARQIKRIPDGADVSVICRRRRVGVRVLGQEGRILRAWVAHRVITFSLTRVFPLLRTCSQSNKRGGGESGGTRFQETSPRWILYELTLILFIHHWSSLLFLIRRLTLGPSFPAYRGCHGVSSWNSTILMLASGAIQSLWGRNSGV